ncbi:hypothetical protein AX16_008139 [Volvariella volvacea WC 439]|nr:hypothetical protein AX16_008139 [Volvariella volvacea WC 439]
MYSYADLLEVITPNNALRDMSRVQCKYFGQCAGCQYQMLSYETQLKLKRDAIFKAYKNYSGLSQCDIPVINETIGSPLQYNYRTKITPHFEAPPKSARDDQGAKKGESPSWLKIGFNRIGTRKVMDIEDCPIATPTIRNALGPVREEIKKNIFNYKKGVSLLFRDSLDPGIEIERRPDSSVTNDTTDASASEAFNRHICITDHNAIVREKVGEDDWIFEYTAGSFFQNNNSVLGPLTRYVREATFAPWDVEQASIIGAPPPDKRPTHLVDAYCGCGLFSITLSPYFSRIAGIELSASSISAATRNLKLNHALHPKLLPDESRCQFLAGDASNIFDVVNGCQGEGFPADKTVLVIDPPRKGCDAKFIQQVIDWGCQTIVYVSCNVNTQARDVGMLMRGMEEMHKDTDHGCGKRRYVLESIRGFDLFPQTAHVECVAVLRLVERTLPRTDSAMLYKHCAGVAINRQTGTVLRLLQPRRTLRLRKEFLVRCMPGLMMVPSSPGLGGLPTHSTPSTPNAKAQQSYADIRAEAIENVEKQIRGASPINLIRTARNQFASGKDYESKGDLKSAYAAFVRSAKLMQVVMESNETKSEKGIGILKKEIQSFMETDAKDLAQRTKFVEGKLQELGTTTSRSLSDMSDAIPINHVSSGIAERMRALQRQGLEVMPKHSVHPTINPPSSPPHYTQSHPQASTSLHTPSSSQAHHHTLVSPSTFGPPSPTSTPSSPQFGTADFLEFSQAFPSIEELDSSFSLPSVPATKPPLPEIPTSTTASSPTDPNAPSFKPFAIPPDRPSSTPITPTYNAFESRPPSPSRIAALPKLSAQKQHRPQLPITNAASPKELVDIMNHYNTLTIDLRDRRDFNREHIQSSAVICIEPIVLNRKGVDADEIENAMTVAPQQEFTMFNNRDKFELIVIYDECSKTVKDNPVVSSFLEKVYEATFRKPLKRSPVLIIGGIEAWKREFGTSGVTREAATTNLTAPTDLSGASTTRSGVTTPPDVPGTKNPFYINGSLISASNYNQQSSAPQSWPTSHPLAVDHNLANQTSNYVGHSRTPAEIPIQFPIPLLNRQWRVKFPGVNTSAQPLINGGPSTISYPLPRKISPTGIPQGVASQFTSGIHTEITSPPQASINPSASSWRRNDFVDQSQEALAPLQGRALPEYPELKPPPAVAPSVLDRQDNRPRIPISLAQFPVPPTPPRINSDWPVPYWGSSKVGTSGLKNLGNTCYMNAPIQCLSATVPFSRFFTEGRWKTSVNLVNPLGSKGILTGAFAKLLHEMWGEDMPYLSPIDFRKVICRLKAQYNGSDQHDSQEFLSFLIDGIHEDLNRVIVKPRRTPTPEEEEELERLPVQLGSEREWKKWRTTNDSLIVDVFQGQFRSRLECLTCHKTSTTYNAFSILQLPIPHVKQGKVLIQHCLEVFFKEEILEKDDAWDCPRCKTKRSALKQLSLARLPPILMVHFKRFEAHGRFSDKVDTFVDFPMKPLDLTRFMPPPLPTSADQTTGPRDDPRIQHPPYHYELYAVTNHYGNLSSGHYTACIQSQNEWLYCDDSTIKKMDPKAVVNQKAYVLFYKRINIENP